MFYQYFLRIQHFYNVFLSQFLWRLDSFPLLGHCILLKGYKTETKPLVHTKTDLCAPSLSLSLLNRASNFKWVLNTFRLTFRNLNLIWEIIGKYSVTQSIEIWQPNFGYFQYWLVKIYDIDDNNSPPTFFMIGWIGCWGYFIFQLLPKLNSNFQTPTEMCSGLI